VSRWKFSLSCKLIVPSTAVTAAEPTKSAAENALSQGDEKPRSTPSRHIDSMLDFKGLLPPFWRPTPSGKVDWRAICR
jgi:hypothetical protein